MFLFPSPHNPGGWWVAETLEKISHYCQQAGVIILSDEVHSDLTLPGKRHCRFTVDEAPEVVNRAYFHQQDLQYGGDPGGIAIIKNDELRHQFYHFLDNCYAETHSLQAAIYSAFTHCADWHQKLVYLADNVAFVKVKSKSTVP
jgi:cystathionine beta-lyase